MGRGEGGEEGEEGGGEGRRGEEGGGEGRRGEERGEVHVALGLVFPKNQKHHGHY